MVRQFHDGMQARVQNDGEYSESFPVTNGVKLVCYGTNTVQHDVFRNAHAFKMLMLVFLSGTALMARYST